MVIEREIEELEREIEKKKRDLSEFPDNRGIVEKVSQFLAGFVAMLVFVSSLVLGFFCLFGILIEALLNNQS